MVRPSKSWLLHRREGLVAGPGHLLLLQEPLLRVLDFRCRNSLGEQPVELFFHHGFEFRHVLRLAACAEHQVGAVILCRGDEVGADAVGESFLLPHAIAQARGEGAAPQNKVAQDQSRIIRCSSEIGINMPAE